MPAAARDPDSAPLAPPHDTVDPDAARVALHEVGRIVGPWGVKGWLKVQPHADDPQVLLGARHWLLHAPEGARAPTARSTLDLVQARRHGEFVVVQAVGIDDRAAAEALRGLRIFVGRNAFPQTVADEYYWVDLIGLQVVNRAGVVLGIVLGLLDTGVHAVLRVGSDLADGAERLIPFVAAYVDDVDLEARSIRVDWGLDY